METYCGPGATPSDWLASWNADPVVIGVLGAALAVHGATAPAGVGRRGAFALGVIALAVAFVSPLCATSAALFSARVVHHLVLTTVAAPLLALALPRSSGRWLATATALHAAIFWAWHAPALYAGALSSDGIYWLMQLTMLGSGVLFWRSVFSASAMAAAAALLGFMVQMGLLGALLTFAPQPLYAPHLLTTWPWGLSPLQDQQLGGLIMWAPASALYLFAALAQVHHGVFRSGAVA